MNRTDSPSKQPKPFGINGPREPILATTPAGDNTASYDVGFPPITMTLKSAGGLPPKGQDVNQILFELSSLCRWNSAGALNTFDSAFSTSIGGYPSGSLVLSNNGKVIYVNKVDANTTDPNSGGAGWVDLLGFMGGPGLYSNVVTFGTSGTYTWPADVKFIEVIVTGAGGGGGGCNATTTSDTYFGAGGGGGGTAFGLIRATDSGAGPGTYTVTVGLGGTGGSGAAPGSDGGDSVFMSLIGGGGKGAKRPTVDNTSGGTGGSASGGYQRAFGAFGQDGQSTTRSISGNGGGSFWGGGGISSNLAAPIARGSIGDGGGGAYDMLFRGVSGSGANGGNGVVVIKEYR
ncbi:glycine-rich domain-containing protein [Enterobacter cloacae]